MFSFLFFFLNNRPAYCDLFVRCATDTFDPLVREALEEHSCNAAAYASNKENLFLNSFCSYITPKKSSSINPTISVANRLLAHANQLLV